MTEENECQTGTVGAEAEKAGKETEKDAEGRLKAIQLL